jgi:hypothetical protein
MPGKQGHRGFGHLRKLPSKRVPPGLAQLSITKYE